MEVTRRAFIANSSLAATIVLANCIPMAAGEPSSNVSVAKPPLTFCVRGWKHLCEPDTEAMLIDVSTAWRSGWH